MGFNILNFKEYLYLLCQNEMNRIVNYEIPNLIQFGSKAFSTPTNYAKNDFLNLFLYETGRRKKTSMFAVLPVHFS